MLFIPVPGYGAGDLSIEGNLAGYIDRIIVPGRLKDGMVDELGYFEHIPSTALVLMGAITAYILKMNNSEYRKVTLLSVTGGGLIVLGVVWGFHFPINKHLWSSSFILTTGGISFLFMALFYLVIDVWRYKKWSIPFMIIGVNSIFIYLASSLINFRYTANYLFNGFMQMTDEAGQAFILQLGVLMLEFLLLYFLYRKKIFFKV
jgi:predicted acyltransferase